MRLRTRIILFSITVFLAGCGGAESGGSAVVTEPQVAASVQILPDGAVLDVGGTATLVASVLDKLSKPISGRTITWTSSNPASATVDAGGVLRAIALGSGVVSATADGKTASVNFQVTTPALVSVSINAPIPSLVAGQQATLTTTLRDRTGATVTNRTLIWTSNAPRVATVSATGVVTALSAGSTLITVSAEGLTGSVILAIAPPAGVLAPTVASLSPATLTAGSSVTITGANFVAGAANDIVYVGGVQATVTSASSTQIVATVSANYPCASTQSVPVDVITAGGSASTSNALTVGTARTLAVGQSFLATAGLSRSCNEMPASGTYLISVFNAAKTSTSLASVELKGTIGSAAGSLASRIPQAGASVAVVGPPATGLRYSRDPVAAAGNREHLEQMQRNIDIVRQLGSPRRARSVPHVAASKLSSYSLVGAGGSAPVALEAVPTTVGAITHLNFHFNSCSLASATPMTARVVYVGPKAIVLEDTLGALAGKVDADLTALAKEWETVSYPALVKNLADPLAYDAQTDKNGRIIMMFTPQVNKQSTGLLGFVSSCDFFPPTYSTSVGASNLAEVFYARAITDTVATSTSLNGRPMWRRQMPTVLAHESKHIASFAERFATPIETDLEQLWLEEATAQLSGEFYARSVHGNKWRDDSPYSVLECELSVASSCSGNLAMYIHYSWLDSFAKDFESASILSNTAADGESLYGGAWLFTRWMTDIYGGNDESAFTMSVVKNFFNYGVDNVVERTGKTWPELLSQFTLMLAADDLPGVASPFIEPSWNLPSIWAGYGSVSTGFAAQPLAVRQAAFGTFSAFIGTLKGGGAMLIKLSGNGGSAPQLLDLHAAGGAALAAASTVGISVLRIQ